MTTRIEPGSELRVRVRVRVQVRVRASPGSGEGWEGPMVRGHEWSEAVFGVDFTGGCVPCSGRVEYCGRSFTLAGLESWGFEPWLRVLNPSMRGRTHG